MKKKSINPALLSLLALVPLLGFSGAQTSAVPDSISYQGRALDGTGANIGTGTPVNRRIIFRIWSHPTNSAVGDLIYSEEQVVTIANGEFSALIGVGSAVTGLQFGYSESGKGRPTVTVSNINVFGSNSRYLGVTIDDGTAAADNEISPRQQFVTSSYAFRAKLAEGVPTGAISSGMLQNGAVGSSQLAVGAVGSSQLAEGAVGSSQLAEGAVRSSQLAAGVVTSDKLANDTVTGAKIMNGSIDSVDLRDGSVTSLKILDGTIAEADLGVGSVSSAKILDGTIAEADLGVGSVSSAKILDGTIKADDLYSDIGGSASNFSGRGYGGGPYNYFRVNGGNSAGYLFGAFNSGADVNHPAPGDAINLSFNCYYKDNDNWKIPNDGLGQSRIALGHNGLYFYTTNANGAWGGNERMRIDSYGAVTIPGTLTTTSQIKANGNSGFGFTSGDTDGGLFSPADGTVAIKTDGVERVRISGGRVGIGTVSPVAPLHVAGFANKDFYSDWIVHGGGTGDQNFTRTEPISIWAENHIAAPIYWVHSDARIKIPGNLSDGSSDLDILKAIEIRDYIHKDKVQMGSQVFKKVIAQQVEAVYPLAVHQSRGVVPDIYKKAKINQDWITVESDLKVGEKVRLIVQDRGPVMEKVLDVRPGAFRTALVSEPTDLFVYGREVEDFRTVDYDALSMLNVSATQELSRQLARVSDENTALRREIEALKADYQSGILALEKRLIEEGLLKPVSLERESAAR